MSKKETKNEKMDMRERGVDAALGLAVERGWEHTSLRDIADALDITLADLFGTFEDKTDILVALGRRIDRRVLEGLEDGAPEDDETERDRLFDLLMDRYEVLNDYRPGLTAILHSFSLDPKQALISLPHLCRSMSWMLEAAGIDTGGIRGALKVAGLGALYLRGVKAWMDDESPDLAKVMARLDKDLNRAEQAANTFGF